MSSYDSLGGISMVLARFRARALAVTIGTAAVAAPLLAVAAPAQAAAAGHGGSGLADGHAGALSVINSDGFAGYQATVAAGSATSSAAQFKVPKLSCTKAYRAITPVAGVEVNNSASYSSAFAFVGCHSGKAVYFPSLVINGTETDYTTTALAAGDTIEVSAKVTTTATTVKVTDVTKAVTKKLTGPGASASAAYAGDSDWDNNGTLLGVPGFGTLTFTHCLIDGAALASKHPVRYQRVNSSGTVQIATGALSSAGTTFPTRYKHS
jgi:hypothetical protein